MKSNLAAAVEFETVPTEVLNAAAIDEMLRSLQPRGADSVRTANARTRRYAPVKFEDRHSDIFASFRIY